MDPDNPAPSPAPEAPAAPAAPAAEGTPPPADPAGTGTPPANDSPEAPAEGDPNPDEPAAPAEGDEPADPAAEPEAPADPESAAPDLKSMTRAERASYFQNLETQSRKDAEARVNDAYQPQPVDELIQKYIDEGNSEFEAKMLAREEVRDQEADISKARAARAELSASLASDSMEVLATIDWLNPAKKDAYDKASSDAAVQLYDELCLSRDPNTEQRDAAGNAVPGTGQIIGASMTPKQFYGLIDRIRSSGTEGARIAGQKAAEEQMAAVAAPSSNNNKGDPSFDQLSTADKREKLRAQGHLIT